MEATVKHWICASFFVFVLVGCNSNPSRDAICEVQIVEVKVPVLVAMKAPPELMAPLVFEDGLPAWLEPSDHSASSALSDDGEKRLRLMLLDLLLRLDAWQKSAETP